ncbi:DNA helicase [Tanacetum coccineum]
MFAMTSFGAKIDDSINIGGGLYVFKVFCQVYHWIGSLCPSAREAPRFLQLYIYDTKNEVENRMRHFGGIDNTNLDPEIVQGLIHFLDAHNELVGGRLFQQYLVGVFCSIKQNRLDYIRNNQSDIRSDHLSGLYDAISRGEQDGYELGNPQFFITFTCNLNWPEIKRYMAQYPELTTSDRVDIVCRVFEQKIQDLLAFLKKEQIFGCVTGVIMEYLVNISKRRAFWSLNENILKISVLTTNTPYLSKKIRRIRACTHQRPRRTQDQYVIWDNEDVHDLRSVETEFPAIVFNDTLTSEATLSCEPTVSSLNDNKIDFRISFDESDDEDYTRDISTDEDFLGPPLSYTLIRDLVLRLCHRMMAHSISGRSHASEKVPAGPARQEGDAGGVAEEALVALGGGDEDE